MLEKMKMSDIPPSLSTRQLVIDMANERAEKRKIRREAIDEIDRIKAEVEKEEERIDRAKKEIKRIREIKKGILAELSELTNVKIAEKANISENKVRGILCSKESCLETQAKIRAEIEKRNTPEYKAKLKAAF